MDSSLASAASDPECSTFYTSDHQLTFDPITLDLIDDHRIDRDLDPLRICSIKEIMP